MLINKKKNFIISTEHGPKGGDEININVNPFKNISNFGWPISSYGEHYDGVLKKDKKIYEKYPLNKNHKQFGFIEPAHYFVPSIGISEVIEIKDNQFIVSSLKDRSIYTFNLNEKYEIDNLRRIYVGERIRI